MVLASTLYGGGGLPVGDALRSGTTTSIGTTSTTILNLTTTNGIIHGVMLTSNQGNTGDSIINEIKLTIDGATERTLTGNNFAIAYYNSGSGDSGAKAGIYGVYLPLPIRFTSSCTIKLKASTTTPGVLGTVIYSVYS